MSYEAEQMQNLRNAIRQEMPELKEEIRIENLLKLVELSDNNKSLNILTIEEKREILEYVKDKIRINQKRR